MTSFMLSTIIEKLSARFKGASENEPSKVRPFRLIQLESALSCNLRCIMCPWKGVRNKLDHQGLMKPEVWESLRPFLPDIRSIDFSGGGEPLLQPRLSQWIREANLAGCQTGFVTNGLLLTPALRDQILSAGLDWICFSVDGSDKATYESIRKGSDFGTVCAHITGLCRSPEARSLKTMITFVIMTVNRHQLTDMIRLARSLGISQVNFKHCDVIRGDHGKGYGLFGPRLEKDMQGLKKDLGRARKLGKKLNVKTTSFSFTPEEKAVCAQDPRDSLFISYNGRAAPCIGLAMGGPAGFLGRNVIMPTIHYGQLPAQNLESIWRSESCTFFKTRFEERVSAHDRGFFSVDLSEPSIRKIKAAHQAAVDTMPPAPDGCRVCHYLYGI